MEKCQIIWFSKPFGCISCSFSFFTALTPFLLVSLFVRVQRAGCSFLGSGLTHSLLLSIKSLFTGRHPIVVWWLPLSHLTHFFTSFHHTKKFSIIGFLAGIPARQTLLRNLLESIAIMGRYPPTTKPTAIATS